MRPVKRMYGRMAAAMGARVPLLLRPFNVATKATVNGQRFRIPVLRGIGLKNRLGHEPWMVDLLERLFRITGSAGLIDVGVNIGQTLLKVKSIDRELRYVGFEPNPFCVSLVQELIAMNGLRGCTLAPVALSDRAGLLAFTAQDEGDDSATVIEDLRPGRRAFREQFIGALVFDDLALDLRGMRLVKIDVEGGEARVLAGMRKFLREARPVVVCEVLHAHSEAKVPETAERNDAMLRLLKALDYGVFRLHKGEGRIVGIEPVDSFPHVAWSHASWDACDYLLVPAERVAEFAPPGGAFGGDGRR